MLVPLKTYAKPSLIFYIRVKWCSRSWLLRTDFRFATRGGKVAVKRTTRSIHHAERCLPLSTSIYQKLVLLVVVFDVVSKVLMYSWELSLRFPSGLNPKLLKKIEADSWDSWTRFLNPILEPDSWTRSSRFLTPIIAVLDPIIVSIIVIIRDDSVPRFLKTNRFFPYPLDRRSRHGRAVPKRGLLNRGSFEDPKRYDDDKRITGIWSWYRWLFFILRVVSFSLLVVLPWRTCLNRIDFSWPSSLSVWRVFFN